MMKMIAQDQIMKALDTIELKKTIILITIKHPTLLIPTTNLLTAIALITLIKMNLIGQMKLATTQNIIPHLTILIPLIIPTQQIIKTKLTAQMKHTPMNLTLMKHMLTKAIVLITLTLLIFKILWF